MNHSRQPIYYSYLWSVVVSGFTVLALSVVEAARGNIDHNWIFLATLTVFTSTLAIKIPEIDSKISIEDTFFFTNLVLFGPAAGTITAALQGFTASVRSRSVRRRLEFTLFNMGALSLSAFISGQVFFGLLGRGPIYNSSPVSLVEILVPTTLLALTHYISNSGSVATIIALEQQKNVYRVWCKNFRWTCVTYFTGASVAALIAVNASSLSPAVLAATAPIILITYFTYKTYKDKVEGQLRELRELNNLYLRTVESLALAVDAKDQTTHGHIRRVREYARGLAHLRGVTDESELLAIDTGALLHDIGKLAVDDYILNKPGKLSRIEFERMKLHSSAGEEILNQIQFPFPVARFVRAHHEHWDGTGYPDGLKGEAIPLGARILAIADAFDAIRSSRPYKDAHSTDTTIEMMREQSGTFFDPGLFEMFARNVNELSVKAEASALDTPELSFRKVSEQLANADCSATAACQGMPDTLVPELASLLDFCSHSGRHLSLSDLLYNLELRVRRLLPCTTCAFFLDAGDHNLRIAHAGGEYRDEIEGFVTDLGKGISGWVAAYGQPAINAKPALEFRNLGGDLCRLSDSLVVPLEHAGNSLGTISLYSASPRVYSAVHLQLLQFVASQAAPVVLAALARNALPPGELTDPVTGCHSIQHLAGAGSRIIAAAEPGPFALIHVGLKGSHDDLPPSDSILREVAACLKSEIRENDILARFGEAGFLLLLATVRKEKAQRWAARMQEQISTAQAVVLRDVSCMTAVAAFPEDGVTMLDMLYTAWNAAAIMQGSPSQPCREHP